MEKDNKINMDKTGFNVSYTVQNNSFINSRCNFCGNYLKNGELILNAFWFNIKDRGEETQFNENFHRECSTDNDEWKKYDSEINRQLKKEEKKQDLKKAIKVLKGNYKAVKLVLEFKNR